MTGQMSLISVCQIRVTLHNLSRRKIGGYFGAKMASTSSFSLCHVPLYVELLTSFPLAGLRIFEELLEVDYLVCPGIILKWWRVPEILNLTMNRTMHALCRHEAVAEQ